MVYISTKNIASTTDLDYDFTDNRINSDAAINLTGLTQNTTYTYYGYVYSTTSNTYYPLYKRPKGTKVAKITFTTDASSYNADVSVKDLSSTTATVNFTNIDPITNLTETIYLTVHKITFIDGTNADTSEYQISYNGTRTDTSGTIVMSNLIPSTTYTCYAAVYSGQSDVTYNINNKEMFSFTTDASSYTATVMVDDVGQNEATINISSLSSVTNLDNNIYISTEDVSITDSLMVESSGIRTDRTGSVSLNGLTPDTDYTYSIYVKSVASNLYYKVGNISFTTVSNYAADVIDYDHTNKSVKLSLINLSTTADLDGKWYVYDSLNPDTVIASANIGEDCIVTGLSAETVYNFIIKVNNIRVNKYYTTSYISVLTLPQISDKFYYGDVFVYNGKTWDECDVFIRNENDDWDEEYPVLGIF